MKCPNCKQENPEGSLFCGNCGFRLTGNADDTVKNDDIIVEKKPKRWLIILAVVLIALCFFLFSGPSVKDVTLAIDSIGSVNLSSYALLEEAAEQYDSLSPSKQEKVSNGQVLFDAIDEYGRQLELAENAKVAIDAIGMVDLDSEAAIADAREKYDLVKKYDVVGELDTYLDTLEAAERDLLRKQNDEAAAVKKAANSVNTIITHLVNARYESAVTIYAGNLDSITREPAKAEYSDSVLSAIITEAQTQYDAGNYYTACMLLSVREYYNLHGDEELLQQAEALEATFVEYLNSTVPKNGEVLARTHWSGRNTIKTTAGPANTCVKLQLVEDPEKYIMFFVKANESFTINMPSGEYKVMYTTGPVWYGKEELFGPNATFIEVPDTIQPNSYTSGDYVYWNTYDWTVEYGYGEDFGAQNMDPDDFFVNQNN